jgi:phosphoribosylglycinamide formyltransferase-1
MTEAALRVGVLVSATGANLATLLRLSAREPDLLTVALVASHGSSAPALEIARRAGVLAWHGDFDQCCGFATAARTPSQREDYRSRARSWHDRLDDRLASWERRHGPLDLVVLAYHRFIEGNLLDRYHGRMINQHPGDLSCLDGEAQRILAGRDPVLAALRAGHRATRTSTFFVDASLDGGAVACMGPAVPTAGRAATREDADAQELLMKRDSDPYCLEWTIRAYAAGRLALSDRRHVDGSPVVLVDGTPTPLGGVAL